VIAHGKALMAKVIAEEKFEVLQKSKKNGLFQQKIKIPNVCKEFKVECGNTFDMVRELKIKLS